MAIARHVQWLKQGVEAWNRRRETRHFVPSLKHADLKGLDLANVNLRGAQLSGADLSNSNLVNANLTGAHLIETKFIDANLTLARLTAAVATKANFLRCDLTNAHLNEVDFSYADMRKTKLTSTYLFGTNFLRSRLDEADITSSSFPADLLYAKGVSQRQLDSMYGDTAIFIPEELQYPSHWPLAERPDTAPHRVTEDPTPSPQASEADRPETFVFVSYSNKDRQVTANLRSILMMAGIPIWWDQDLGLGDQWRSKISDSLDSATAVLTLWTKNSAQSLAVREEAARAQVSRKLVQVRLDDAEIPYGFSETQYADLRSWDGSADHPEILKLAQALKDKLFPPSKADIVRRLDSAAPLVAVLEEGKIASKDSPPNTPPPQPDEADLESRLKAQEVLANKAKDALEQLDNNIGKAILFDLAHLAEQLSLRPASWYILSDSISDVKVYLDLGDEISWPGSTRNMIESLCRNHELLRPRLQPIQPIATSPAAPLPPPIPRLDNASDETLRTISETANEIFSSPEAENVMNASAIRTGEYLTVEIDEVRRAVAINEKAEEQRRRKLGKIVTALAGFVGTAITAISTGVGASLLTSPDAGRTLLEILTKLQDMLIALF
ncbi:MAG: toll/interleukin-1 receptor domain-containing protein [Rhizobium rhizophilum]|uniref:toll/interleukin-1 receptor domain-containing protein n=1 Tax=Rhizobium rhizophilum TaxID=1850373 RepID=UPI00391D3105